MPTSYQEIYFKSASLIDSYKITQAIEESPISFFKVMYPFLLGAISELVHPTELYEYLQYRKEPINEVQKFHADGTIATLNLAFSVDNYLDNVFFEVLLDGAKLEEGVDYNYNPTTNSIELTEIPTIDSIIVVEYYYVGEVLGTSNESLNVQLTDLSTQLIASIATAKWLEKAKNRELTIKANLGAKEYQMFSPANLLKENRELYQQAYDRIVSEQNNLSWKQKILRARNGKQYNLFAIVEPKRL